MESSLMLPGVCMYYVCRLYKYVLVQYPHLVMCSSSMPELKLAMLYSNFDFTNSGLIAFKVQHFKNLIYSVILELSTFQVIKPVSISEIKICVNCDYQC